MKKNKLALKIKLNGCNFKCIYCPESNKGEGINNIEEIKQVLKESYNLGIKEIRWSGGEPTVFKEFLELVKYAEKLKYFQTLSSNGSFKPSYLKKLKKYGIKRINISLDTLNPKRFKDITQTNLFNQVKTNIKLASRIFDYPTKINMVILKDNLDEIPNMIEFSRNEGVILRFMQLTYKGSRKFVEENRVSIEEIKKHIPNFNLYKKVKINKKEGRNPVTQYYKYKNFTVGIITQDFKCIKDKCYKIWYENNYLTNCKIDSSHFIPLKNIPIKEALKKLIKEKNFDKSQSMHKIKDRD